MVADHPYVLLLSFDFQGIQDELYVRKSALYECLESVSLLHTATTPSETFYYLENYPPKAIIVTSEGIAKDENKHVLEAVKDHTLRGGRLIIGLAFARWLTTAFTGERSVFDKFFGEGLGLKWREGGFLELQYEFNPACILSSDVNRAHFLATALRPLNNLGVKKVLGVKNAEEHEKIYKPVAGLFTQAQVDEMDAGVVGVGYGHGFVGYVGDCYLEVKTVEVVLALCGF